VGSEMWFRCKSVGCFDEDVGDDKLLGGSAAIEDLIREDAEREFSFAL